MRTELLKNLLGIKNYSRNEKIIKDYIKDYCSIHNYVFHCDDYGNIMAHNRPTLTKTLHPYLISHLDSVHLYNRGYNLNVKDGIIYGTDDLGNRVGVGGDDKAGVFTCLEIMHNSNLPVTSVFFVEEEIGMLGSQNFNYKFFNDASYVLSYDAPGRYSYPVRLCGKPTVKLNSEFFFKINKVLERNKINKIQNNAPYTDALQVSRSTNIQTLNLPCGYYYPHQDIEIVHLPSLKLAIKNGLEMISSLIPDRKYLLADKDYENTEYSLESFSMENLVVDSM